MPRAGLSIVETVPICAGPLFLHLGCHTRKWRTFNHRNLTPGGYVRAPGGNQLKQRSRGGSYVGFVQAGGRTTALESPKMGPWRATRTTAASGALSRRREAGVRGGIGAPRPGPGRTAERACTARQSPGAGPHPKPRAPSSRHLVVRRVPPSLLCNHGASSAREACARGCSRCARRAGQCTARALWRGACTHLDVWGGVLSTCAA